jgi:hypothetical protein
VPAIIADRIIEAAKNGERDPSRLYEQALKAFGFENMSMLPRSPLSRLCFGTARSVILDSPVDPRSRALA